MEEIVAEVDRLERTVESTTFLKTVDSASESDSDSSASDSTSDSESDTEEVVICHRSLRYLYV